MKLCEWCKRDASICTLEKPDTLIKRNNLLQSVMLDVGLAAHVPPFRSKRNNMQIGKLQIEFIMR